MIAILRIDGDKIKVEMKNQTHLNAANKTILKMRVIRRHAITGEMAHYLCIKHDHPPVGLRILFRP